MMKHLSRLYNFRGRLSRRDFLTYWLWVYLLPKNWPFLAAIANVLLLGKESQPLEIAGGVALSVSVQLLLVSFFLGAIWRRLNDIGFALWPKLLICALMFVLPPFGWMLQLTLLLLPSRRQK